MSQGTIQSHLTSYKMQLKTEGPVFIGGGENADLGKTQYIFDPGKKIIHILDEKAWAGFLARTHYYNDYLEFITRFSKQQTARRGQPSPRYQGGLFEWLSEKRINPESYKGCIRYSINASQVERGHDLRCFIKDSYYRPYIPGSSIKGALRTAVLYNVIQNDKASFVKAYWNSIKDAINSQDIRFIKREFKKAAGVLEEDAFYTIVYPEQRQRKSAINDVFKGIEVSDSLPISPENLTALKKLDLSTYEKNGNYLKELPIFREYLKPGTEATFLLTIDKTLLSNDPCLKDFNAINACLKTLAKDLLDIDRGLNSRFKRLRDFNRIDIPSPEANLCIGGGAGFLAKSVIMALAPSKEEAFNVIKEYLNLSFYQHKHRALDGNVSPRTLKLAKIEQEMFLTGWCSIRMVEQLC